MPDIVQALRSTGTVVLAEDLRDASNRLVDEAQVRKAWGPAAPKRYATQPTPNAIAELIAALKK